jgi:TonB family protein
LAIFLVIVALNSPVSALASSDSPLSGWTVESILRAHATRTLRPEYPTDALLAGSYGVVVVEINLDITGLVAKQQILEAPCESIAKAVTQAVDQWHFGAFKDSHGRPMLVSGKLTFYFEIKDRKGFVLNPDETGYVGPGPDKSSHNVGKTCSAGN